MNTIIEMLEISAQRYPDNKQLNSLGKMVRSKIVERHKDKIDYLYTPEAKSIVNPRNVEAIRKLLHITS